MNGRAAHLLPLYRQVKEYMRSQIESGAWPPGSVVPSESELIKVFGFARGTVRQAVQELTAEGVLIPRQGRGTFVAEPKVSQGLTRLSGFSADMKRLGHNPETRVIESGVVEATAKVATHLRLAPGERVVHLVRIRLANAEPMNLETSYLPIRLFPNLVDEDLSGQSLYELITDKYGIPIVRTTEYVEPVQLDEVQASHLAAEPKSLGLLLERITESHNGLPVEFCRTVIRGDRGRLVIETGPK